MRNNSVTSGVHILLQACLVCNTNCEVKCSRMWVPTVPLCSTATCLEIHKMPKRCPVHALRSRFPSMSDETGWFGPSYHQQLIELKYKLEAGAQERCTHDQQVAWIIFTHKCWVTKRFPALFLTPPKGLCGGGGGSNFCSWFCFTLELEIPRILPLPRGAKIPPCCWRRKMKNINAFGTRF